MTLIDTTGLINSFNSYYHVTKSTAKSPHAKFSQAKLQPSRSNHYVVKGLQGWLLQPTSRVCYSPLEAKRTKSLRAVSSFVYKIIYTYLARNFTLLDIEQQVI
jgi:hypothetical protein